MNLWVIFVLVDIFLILVYFKDWIRILWLGLRIEGPKLKLLINNLEALADKKFVSSLTEKATKKYGYLTKVWVLCIPFFIVLDPRYVQLILYNSKNEKNFFYTFLDNFLGKGLATLRGEKYKYHRKLLQPSFSVSTLETYVKTFVKGANVTAKIFKDKSKVNITGYINDCIMEILYEIVMGIPIGEQLDLKSESPFRKGKVQLENRLTRPWLLLDFIYKNTASSQSELNQQSRLQNFASKVLSLRLEELKQNPPNNSDHESLLDVMINISKEHSDFTEEDIVGELCTFLLAGQDTVGGSTCFALYLLAKHQEIQQKALEEIECILPRDTNVVPSMEQINNLKYLDQCIKEALRMYPTVPLMIRHLCEDINVGDYTLPKGSQVILSSFLNHRIEETFPNPEEFNPDRFAPEKVEKLHTCAYFPFSAGPKSCIGYKFALIETKILLATILRHYHLSIEPGHELNLYFRVTLRAKGGLWINFSPRNK